MTHNPNVYGYVNGKPVFSRDEFIFEHRKRGPIEDDAELIAFAEKATSGWHNAGWSHSFISFYLSDYALSEPFASLTLSEFGRLKELQQEAREAAKAADDARCWRLKETINWADNSVEEIYEDKDGNTKHVTVVGPQRLHRWRSGRGQRLRRQQRPAPRLLSGLRSPDLHRGRRSHRRRHAGARRRDHRGAGRAVRRHLRHRGSTDRGPLVYARHPESRPREGGPA